MTKSHLKRLFAPKTWPIDRKKTPFITRPAPTGSAMQLSIPLVIAFKNMLKLATTTKEVKHILHSQEVLIDGKRVYDHDQSVGFMGVISIPAAKIYYRLIITDKNVLKFVPITSAEAKARPCKVKGKTIIGKDKVQINCLDGTNFLVKKDEFPQGMTVLYDTEKKTVSKSLPLEKGALVLLYQGSHVGHLATIENIDKKTVQLKTDDDKVFETKTEYCFVVGKNKPEFTVG